MVFMMKKKKKIKDLTVFITKAMTSATAVSARRCFSRIQKAANIFKNWKQSTHIIKRYFFLMTYIFKTKSKWYGYFHIMSSLSMQAHKMCLENDGLVFGISGRGPTVPVLPLPPLQWTATASLSSNALSAISRNLSIWFGVGACTSSMGMTKQGNFFQLLLPIFLPKWKKCANPTRSFLALNISLKRCSGWLQLNFRFGSEMGKKG